MNSIELKQNLDEIFLQILPIYDEICEVIEYVEVENFEKALNDCQEKSSSN